MIERALMQEVLERACVTGADFSEIYCERRVSSGISLINSRIENAIRGEDFGVGLRVLAGTRCVYAYCNDASRQSLMTLADNVAAAIEGSGSVNVVLVPYSIPRVHPAVIKQYPNLKLRASLLKEADAAARTCAEISQVSCGITDSYKEIIIANSEGRLVRDERAYCRLAVSAIAANGMENQSGSEVHGAQAGEEFLFTLDAAALGKAAAKSAVTMLHAPLCPAGVMPVVMENGFGGVIFHEACGHSLEATSVAKGNSVFCGKLGQRIGTNKVTAVDDGTIPGAWGSLNINDEGEPTRKNVLVENGILKSYLIDRLGSRRMGLPQTGSGRRESYKFAPTSRMTNTYIAPGTDRNEDIIASVDNGLYAAKMGGGSVNPITCDFNFAVLEGYLIKNGKISSPVRGATLVGKGNEILFNIDMVGKELASGQGMCGSESGSIPTNVGQPMIKISSITVGGK